MEQLLYLCVGAVLTWSFYFVQRRVERRRTGEMIDRHQRLLALKQGLDEANVNLDDLRRFEHRLLGKAESAVRIADNYFSKAEVVSRQGGDALDQAAMNQQAKDEFRRVDARLREVYKYLRAQLGGDDLAMFQEAHLAWLEFRNRYAHFISQSYSGGAIRPLIHAVTLESLTAAWIAELETQLGGDGSDDDSEESYDVH